MITVGTFDIKPNPFLTVRVHEESWEPSLCGICVGYENGEWRYTGLADHIVEWLPEFALNEEECKTVDHASMVGQIRRAAKVIYKSKKFKNRGEFGELFLHAAIRQVHNSIPAISKIYYKTSTNETVKGFDAVHVVGSAEDIELWLGEAKFYKGLDKAVSAVIKEIKDHLVTDYLREEFILISNKIRGDGPIMDRLKTLLSPNTSLDEVFDRVCIPVLLTYESDCVDSHTKCTKQYIDDFKEEVKVGYQKFADKLADVQIAKEIRVHLFLMPLHKKYQLVQELDRKLRAWQNL